MTDEADHMTRSLGTGGLLAIFLILLAAFWIFLAIEAIFFQSGLFKSVGFLLVSQISSYLAFAISVLYILDAFLVWRGSLLAGVLTFALLTLTVPCNAILIIAGIGTLPLVYLSLAPEGLSTALLLIGVFGLGLNLFIALLLHKEFDILY